MVVDKPILPFVCLDDVSLIAILHALKHFPHDATAQQHHDLKQISLDEQEVRAPRDLQPVSVLESFGDLSYQGIHSKAPPSL